MLDADTVINNSFQKVGGSNAYPDPAPKKVGGSRRRETHRIYASVCVSTVSCAAKTDEPIEMLFALSTREAPGNHAMRPFAVSTASAWSLCVAVS